MFAWKLACIFCSLLLLRSHQGIAQSVYHGIVADSTTLLPLADVNIMIKGRNYGVVSDVKGYFSIQARDSDTLLLSLVGYYSKAYAVRKFRETMIVYLAEHHTILQPIVINAKVFIPGLLKIPKAIPWRNPTQDDKVLQTPGLPTVQTFGPGYVFSGVLSRFTREEKEKRKLVRVKKANENAKGYVEIVNSAEVKERLIKDYDLTEEAYYRLLATFNEKNKDIIYELNADELISLIFIFYAENARK
jgi:hypothetical protein